MMISIHEPNEILCYFLSNPREAIARLITELREYWQRTLAHHWNQMMSVLENDILHHSRVLTLHGAEGLFPALSEFLDYQTGEVIMKKPALTIDDFPDNFVCPVDYIDGNRLYLTPNIFAGNAIFHQFEIPWEPMIIYTSRGAGLWNYEIPKPDEALELTIGSGKARLIMALDTPASTGELARKLALTAGAVSQQLGKLHQAGLVESHRSGKHVFYRLSQRGQQLVSLFG